MVLATAHSILHPQTSECTRVQPLAWFREKEGKEEGIKNERIGAEERWREREGGREREGEKEREGEGGRGREGGRKRGRKREEG